MSAARVIVKLTEPEVAGSYVVVERRRDGSLILEPESVDAVIEEFADRVLTEAEHDDMFRRLDAAADRDVRISALLAAHRESFDLL
ncbi:MAG: hypothetical protein ACR2LK_15025 [Solirubrobacteraceae bacterium]